MLHFKGFKTKKEATAFKNEQGRGSVCGKDGPNYTDWKECVVLGGLNGKEFPFVVRWTESKF